jgi:hypothetical protein
MTDTPLTELDEKFHHSVTNYLPACLTYYAVEQVGLGVLFSFVKTIIDQFDNGIATLFFVVSIDFQGQ